jgi:hypothetical protein
MISTLVRELSLGRPDADVTGLVRHVYPRLMTRLMQDGAELSPDRFVEIRYDALRRQPLTELERVHRTLSLPGFAAYLDRVRDHVPHAHRINRADAAWMNERCAAIFPHWNYDPPSPHHAP